MASEIIFEIVSNGKEKLELYRYTNGYASNEFSFDVATKSDEFQVFHVDRNKMYELYKTLKEIFKEAEIDWRLQNE